MNMKGPWKGWTKEERSEEMKRRQKKRFRNLRKAKKIITHYDRKKEIEIPIKVIRNVCSICGRCPECGEYK